MTKEFKLILATSNKDKAREIAEILSDTPFVVTTMKEEGYDPDIVEDGKTFEENALIKARTVHALAEGAYVMADDSGLCIDALDGAPGIYSARFCGENSTYPEKFAKIFEMLKDVPEEKRTAKFVCSIAVVRPDGSEFTVRGEVCGVLHEKPMGDGGFGYDPIFYVPEFGMTTAQMTKEQKNSISHRGKASRAMAEKLKADLG
ncbi:MAG: XTP/dITP diphosphatase [Clostridiales bacterium]|nr:XTP/dITP diphosphatase [Clostridiales bacterium]MBR2597834.1 XTP/dITP diphosphatase [Clostridiales bacterium]MBR6988000.1 XTP/dITP diphosphatase [Clostridiales bacterium]